MAQDIAVFQVGAHSDALLPDGTVLARVHPSARCAGRPCVIHNPTEHSMRDWPIVVRQMWINPTTSTLVFERLCTHGTGHPDPDQDAFWTEVGGEHLGVHGCCGCCSSAAPPDA